MPRGGKPGPRLGHRMEWLLRLLMKRCATPAVFAAAGTTPENSLRASLYALVERGLVLWTVDTHGVVRWQTTKPGAKAVGLRGARQPYAPAMRAPPPRAKRELWIVSQLRRGGMTVQDLADAAGVGRDTLDRPLRALRQAGVVIARDGSKARRRDARGPFPKVYHLAIPDRPRAACPECRRIVVIRADGGIPLHRAAHKLCAGSGKMADAQGTEKWTVPPWAPTGSASAR